MSFGLFAAVFTAAIVAGIINAVAGGGTLITFPLLTVLGVPAISANITNTIALSPGYLGGTYAQRNDLRDQGKRIRLLLPVCIAGGLGGGMLLIKTGEKNFSAIIPYLILFASLLLAVQPFVKKMLASKQVKADHNTLLSTLFLIFPASLYGGYFGAGVSVIIIAALGLAYKDSLTRLNALKQLLSFAINCSVAVFFLFSKQVNWPVAAVMAAGAIIGGYLGGKIADRINPDILRWVIVITGVTISIFYFIS